MEDAMDIEKVSAVEFFREHVDSALCNQKVEATELTVFYLVYLLAKFMSPARDPRYKDGPLVLMYKRAVTETDLGYTERSMILRELGEKALFYAGFFSDSFKRSLVDVEYYMAWGVHAYRYLGARESDSLSPVFVDLAKRFVVYTDVLSEVSERTHCSTNADLLRLYEKWLKTGSPRIGNLLVERGLTSDLKLAQTRIH